MKIINLLLIETMLILVGNTSAQTSTKKNIYEALQTADSASHATVKMQHDKRIEQLVIASKSGISSNQGTSTGYRVQVFSSNTQRTAKSEAFKIEKKINEEFPEQAVYVNYSSPFWKVRVGDFKTQAQAQSFRSQLIEVFPTMRTEAYIVREQIHTSGSK